MRDDLHPVLGNRNFGQREISAPALGKGGVGIDAAVAEKRPDAAEILDRLEIEVVVEDFLVFGGGLGDQFAVGICDERAAPELGVVLGAGAVDGGEVAAVGDGVAALHGFPCAVLGRAEGGFFLGQPADGGRVNEDLSAAQRHQAGSFRIPLVPANQDADFSKFRVPNRPSAIAGGEVKFLFECGILRDVGFPIESHQRAVGIVDGGGVVIESGAAVLEQRGNQHDPEFASKFSQTVGDWAGEGIGEIEACGILDGAKIWGEKQLLGDHDVGAVGGGLADEFFVVIEGFRLGGEGAGLEEGEARHGRSITSCDPSFKKHPSQDYL